jgi:muramoyltetrapeptide carboxypeptidase
VNNLGILRSTGLINVFAPASHRDDAVLQKALQGENWLSAVYGKELSFAAPFLPREPFMSFAGTDAQRAAELQALLAKPAFLMAANGGYGCIRLLQNLVLSGEERVVLCGFSDLTALINYLPLQTKVSCFHGPMLLYPSKMVEGGLLEKSWRDFFIDCRSESDFSFNGEMLFAEHFSGILAGGNLATLCSLFGTPYAVPLQDRVLFLEDIDEQVYRVDRMLTQLAMQPDFSALRGLVFGNFSVCDPRPGSGDPDLNTLLHAFAEKWGKPVIIGAPIGHIADFPLLPIGGKAEFKICEGGQIDCHLYLNE